MTILLILFFSVWPHTEPLGAEESISPVWIDHDSVQAIWDREETWSLRLRKGRKCWSFTADTTTNNIVFRVWSVHDSTAYPPRNVVFPYHITIPDTLIGTTIIHLYMGITPQYPRKVWK